MMTPEERRFETVQHLSTIVLPSSLVTEAVRVARDVLSEALLESRLDPLGLPEEIYALTHFWDPPDEVVTACLIYGLAGHACRVDSGLVATRTNQRVAEILSRCHLISARFLKKRSMTNLRPFALLADERDLDVLFTLVAGLILTNEALVRELDNLAGNDKAARQLLFETAREVPLSRRHAHNQGLMFALAHFDHPIKKIWLAQLA